MPVRSLIGATFVSFTYVFKLKRVKVWGVAGVLRCRHVRMEEPPKEVVFTWLRTRFRVRVRVRVWWPTQMTVKR